MPFLVGAVVAAAAAVSHVGVGTILAYVGAGGGLVTLGGVAGYFVGKVCGEAEEHAHED